ncbi:twin-arginine translocation signal domain-containing protein [Faecalibacterium wellingii]|uniref:Twin-arginine translocation signal domain-containing protein n=1 Tax=Faecalibacterium wellingii TaxID=2929491 RepID=A0ABU3TWG7_9FIRM|nr:MULTISPECIES: twin-arginine translocation signal domain-containing protein [Faecalibacterium]MDU8687652.1 twin-arginine translocation signal domain-containing protein [Faecalibacterium prausnitzii]UQK57228.1 twin-arginine translocation signal domain-containing protein [Faecalibacterium sp. HTF-F]
MKELNRREFLTLTGAAVVALSLAGCSGGPSAPPAPTTPKEADLLAAINKVWKEKYDAGAVVNKQLILNQDAVGIVRGYGRVFEEANETPHKWVKSDDDILSDERLKFRDKMKKYGDNSFAGMVCDEDTDGMVALKYKYSCEDTVVQAFVEDLLNSNSNSSNAEFISIYFPVVKNVTYMTAAIFLYNKA